MVVLMLLVLLLQLLTGTQKGAVFAQSTAPDDGVDQPSTEGGERQLRERRRKNSRNKARARGPRGQFILVQPTTPAPTTHAKPLLRFAVISDTHFWLPTSARLKFGEESIAKPVRDGLLVSDSEQVLRQLFAQLKAFAQAGGDFAIHAGDAVCGGASFHSPQPEFRSSLQSYREQERAALGDWPVYHRPRNPDLDPLDGGSETWHKVFCHGAPPLANSTVAGHAGSGPCRSSEDGPLPPNYRSLHAGQWRILLMDGSDGVKFDTDGHGHVGEEQLAWLRRELDDSLSAKQQVILVLHQLLAMPATDASWLDEREDFVDNRAEVLALLARYEHVRLSLHGHVHANSLTTQNGIAFVSTAAAGEYPMQWREVSVYRCEVRLITHTLELPELREKSRHRDSRTGRNEIKLGPAIANSISLRTCE